jgi:hypothetical protein
MVMGGITQGTNILQGVNVTVTSLSGSTVNISGGIVLVSGQVVLVSGQTLNVNVASGSVTAYISGNVVYVSGQNIQVYHSLTAVDSTTTNISGVNNYYETASFKTVSPYEKLTMTLLADTAITVSFEFSSDNTNIDAVQSYYYAGASAQVGYQVDVVSPYFKMKLLNTGTTNTTLRCYCWGYA